MKLRTSVSPIVLVVAVLGLGLAAGGCGTAANTTTLVGPPTTMLVMQVTTTTAPAPETTTTTAAPAPETTTTATEAVQITVPTTEAAPVKLSENAIAYAAQLGGKSYMGQDLYLIIGASKATEAECQAALDKATPLFGDMQDYFVIQRSDNFIGLEPGFFVLIEAHRDQPSPEDLQFAQRGFPDAYVKTATVNTTDPLPVFEDVTGGSAGE